MSEQQGSAQEAEADRLRSEVTEEQIARIGGEFECAGFYEVSQGFCSPELQRAMTCFYVYRERADIEKQEGGKEELVFDTHAEALCCARLFTRATNMLEEEFDGLDVFIRKDWEVFRVAIVKQ